MEGKKSNTGFEKKKGNIYYLINKCKRKSEKIVDAVTGCYVFYVLRLPR